jgi:hypothetical protein
VQPSCLVVAEEGDPCVVTTQPDQTYQAAGVFLAFLLIIIGVFEVWALWTHNRTISQWLQHHRSVWAGVLGTVALAVLAWHWFWH